MTGTVAIIVTEYTGIKYHPVSSSETLDWTFSTVMFWGETMINGEWSLMMIDTSEWCS